MGKITFYTSTFFAEKRTQKDPVADSVIRDYFSNPDGVNFHQLLNGLKCNKDILRITGSTAFDEYFLNNKALPKWVDPEKMKKGASFFSKYSEDILKILGLYSLPYCYAAANGAEVLMISQKIRSNPQKRFLDTAEFLMDVMAPNAFQPRGKGQMSALKIRLLHAYIRYQIEKSNKWSKEWGPPINQEDMAATNLTFSLLVVRGLRKLGRDMDRNDVEAYLHLWNVIGFLLGIDVSLLPDTLKEAYVIDKSVSRRQFKESYAGKELTASLIGYLKSSVPPYVNKEIIPLYMRFFIGEKVGDLIGIEKARTSEDILKGFHSFTNFLQFFKAKERYYHAAYLVSLEKRKMNQDLV